MQDQFTSERAHTTSPRNSWSRSWSFCRDYKTSHKTLLNPLVDGEPISMSLLIYEKPSCSQSFVCHVQRRKKNKKNKLILLQHGPVTVTNNKLINNLIRNLIKVGCKFAPLKKYRQSLCQCHKLWACTAR
jgi:hypothetical protein